MYAQVLTLKWYDNNAVTGQITIIDRLKVTALPTPSFKASLNPMWFVRVKKYKCKADVQITKMRVVTLEP